MASFSHDLPLSVPKASSQIQSGASPCRAQGGQVHLPWAEKLLELLLHLLVEAFGQLGQ